MSDDDEPELSDYSKAALAEFLAEQQQASDRRQLSEDWQLSQFWYDASTSDALAAECLRVVPSPGKIALISCPSVMAKLFAIAPDRCVLFEYDDRFATLYPTNFVHYDFADPLAESVRAFANQFELVVVDPPFLSEECLAEMAKTVRLIGRDWLLCTGAVMEHVVGRVLGGTRVTTFVPMHAQKLANEFACFASYADCKLGM